VRRKEKKRKEPYRLSPGDYQQAAPNEKNDWVRVKVRSEKRVKRVKEKRL